MVNIKSELEKVTTRFNPESGAFDPLSIQPRVGAWALNGTGYDLRQGYLVAITDYDATKRLFSIARPDSNGMKNVAVVKSEYVAAGYEHLVELVLLGENPMVYCRDTATNDMLDLRLWWGGTSPSGHNGDAMSACPPVGALVGTLADSFECAVCAGGPFMALGDGSTIADVSSSKKRVRVGFAGCGAYSGYFAVVPWGEGEVRVLDGSGENDDTAGPALINGESFTIAAKTISYSTSGADYIWLQATSTDSAINTPTIESGSSAPAYEEGKCKILLARVIAGRVVQEHTGPVQGIIWGDCES